MVTRHCRRRAIYWLLRSPSQTCHAKPKTQISTGADVTSFFLLVDAYRKQLGLKDFPKSQDAVALQQIKERGALPMIDRGDIRQAIDRCSNIWAWRALVMVSSSIKGWQLNCKIVLANGREIDVWAESPRLSPPKHLYHRLPVMGC